MPIQRLVILAESTINVQLQVPSIRNGGAMYAGERAVVGAGGAFIVAAAATRIGLETVYAGPWSDGPNGRLLQIALERGNVCLESQLKCDHDISMTLSLVEADGEVRYLAIRHWESWPTIDLASNVAIRDGDAVYVSGYSLVPTGGAARAVSDWYCGIKRKVIRFFDPSPLVGGVKPEILRNTLSCTDVLSCTVREGQIMTGRKEVATVLKVLAGMVAGAGVVVLRDGGRGAWVRSELGAVAHIPAFRARVVLDSTGAGDTHVGALAAFLAKGWTLDRAVAGANVAAGIAVERVGPATCPSYRELVARLAHT